MRDMLIVICCTAPRPTDDSDPLATLKELYLNQNHVDYAPLMAWPTNIIDPNLEEILRALVDKRKARFPFPFLVALLVD